MLETALRCRSVRKTFKKVGFFRKEYIQALKGIDIEVFTGESYGIVGESGSGKSTLCRIIAGLDRDFHGTVEVMGENVRECADLPRKVQIIFQNPYASLNPLMKVGDILMEGVYINGIEGGRETVIKLLKRVGLGEDSMDRYPHQFSGGERQRIAIVRALSLSPRILVADEPLSALDLSIQAEVMELIKELKDELSLTLVFVSHDLRVVKEMCTRIAVILDGYLVEEGSSSLVFENPLHPYTSYLLDSVPPPHPRLRRKRIEMEERTLEGACPFYKRCPKALEICRDTVPPLKDLGGRKVRCHNPL